MSQQYSTETISVQLTAREIAILEGGLFELAVNVMRVDETLHNKLKEALAALPSKHCLKWCCLESDNPQLRETHLA